MVRRLSRVAPALLALFPVLPLSAQEWGHDYAGAVRQAGEQDKDLLVLFTGSDWCQPCKKLHDAVFTSSAFADVAARDYLLVELDFPRTVTLPEELVQQNEALRTRFRPAGYPTVLLLGADERPFGVFTGYRDESPSEYLARFEEARSARPRQRAALEAAAALTGKERAAALGALLDALPGSLLRFYEDVAKEAVRLDPEQPSYRERLAQRRRREQARRVEQDRRVDPGRRGEQGRTAEAADASEWVYDASDEIHDHLHDIQMGYGDSARPPAVDSPAYEQAVQGLLVGHFKMGGWPPGALGNRALLAVARWADHRKDVAMFRRCIEDFRVVRRNLGGNEAIFAWLEERHRQLVAGTAEGDFLAAFMNRGRAAPPSVDSVLERLMKADSDGDGLLTAEELGKARDDRGRLPLDPRRIPSMDSDGDGKLSAEEIETFFVLRQSTRRR